MALDYKSSGVDIEAGYKAVSMMKEDVQKTFRKEVLSSLGSFAGLFSLAEIKKMRDPVLLSGTDGVGTKLKLAFEKDLHTTIGIDCVAMCVNDIAAQGAEPLFFLDYIACGRNIPEKIAMIVKGIADGCVQAGCALIGGETAEHPGLMPQDEYDLAGFAVGVCEKDDLIGPERVDEKDVLLGVASSGVHSNGFSLVRRILMENKITKDTEIATLGGNVYEHLLTPTRIYVRALRALKEGGITVHGASHITGGGFYENIPRMLPAGIGARIKKNAYPVPAVFEWLALGGDVSEQVMYNTFNMGLGMVLALAQQDADKALRLLGEAGEEAYIVGDLKSGETGVELC
ncbi:MAG: phosphoribosylformylglycinamidine cyclo-ligase [Lachnospiraceae bacterium]|nr:phosphoribosylformylglycinamidine cyclo-ligase [Lachnospiraceae bacterium]